MTSSHHGPPRPTCSRRLSRAALLTTLALVAGSPVAEAQVTFGGQLRPRSEIRDPVDGGTEAFTSMRTRLHLSSALGPDISAFVQVQDVRFWGEELSTLGDFDADAFDLHQAWVEFGHEGASPLWLRVGRQEVKFGGERLVGAVDWTQQARAFDGVRGAVQAERFRLDVIGFQLAEEASSTFDADASFIGGYGVWDAGKGRALDLYALYDRDEGLVDRDRTTLGLRYHADSGPWSYRLEGSWQTGEQGDDDIEAYMLGGRIGRTVAGGNASVTLWYDLLSGDEDPADSEIGTFSTLFATNHKFYGFADLFLDIPVATAGRGLQDLAVKTWLDVSDDVRLSLDFHEFLATEDRGLSTRRFGEELDLTATWSFRPDVTFTGGLSYIVQGDAFMEIGRLAEDMFWSYLMLNVEL